MRFVSGKSEEVQGAAMVFRVRELLIRQRTQAINALRGHLTEFGQIVPQGAANAARLIAIVEDPDSGLPFHAAVPVNLIRRCGWLNLFNVGLRKAGHDVFPG